MEITQKYLDELTYEIIGAAIEVHKELGSGLLESVYEVCMLHELQLRGIKTSSQQEVPIIFKGVTLDTNLRMDLFIEELIVVELKAVERILPIHEAQILSYLKLLKKPKGILINFNCSNIFNEGQKTFVNKYYAALPIN